MNTPVRAGRDGRGREGSRGTMRNRPYLVLKCSSLRFISRDTLVSSHPHSRPEGVTHATTLCPGCCEITNLSPAIMTPSALRCPAILPCPHTAAQLPCPIPYLPRV